MVDLVTVQIALVPLFLSRFYGTFHDTRGPYMGLFTFLAIPTIYIAILSYLTLRKRSVRSMVWSGIRSGVLFALLFVTLALGPWAVPFYFDHLSELFKSTMLVWQFGKVALPELLHDARHHVSEPLLLCLVVLIHFVVLGAAVGGVAGLVCERFRRTSQRAGH